MCHCIRVDDSDPALRLAADPAALAYSLLFNTKQRNFSSARLVVIADVQLRKLVFRRLHHHYFRSDSHLTNIALLSPILFYGHDHDYGYYMY